MFTRCLKRRPDPATGKFRWLCRRSVARCKCWSRRPREIKEIKLAAPPSPREFDAESSTDQNSRCKPLKGDQKLKKHIADNVQVKAIVKKNVQIREVRSADMHEYNPEYDEEVEQVLEGKKPKRGSSYGR